MLPSSTKDEIYLSPGDLCERWRIDWKTLNKLPLPWVHVSVRVRRINLSDVEHYEDMNRLAASS